MVDVPAGRGFAWDPARLRARLHPADRPHDADLPVDVAELRPAAVLALVLPPAEPSADDPGHAPRLLLIERSSSLRAHAGQIAFPGGKPEPGDASLAETARREACEEVGLDRDIDVLGRLDPVPTPTGFLVVPFVAFAPSGWEPRITSMEVKRLITPSIARLRDPAVHRVTGRVSWKGGLYDMHEYAICQPRLWGATARMVWDLLRRTSSS